jgi:hypothetical protein
MASSRNSRDLEAEALDALRINRPILRQTFAGQAVLALLFTAVVLFVILSGVTRAQQRPILRAILQTVPIAPAFIAFLLGYLQWRANRHEVSFDKYYDRLDKTNAAFDGWRTVALPVGSEELRSHKYTMFIFSELDTLEYVLEKYKLGFVRRELAERAIRGFTSRCRDQDEVLGREFRTATLYWIGTNEGNQVAHGYHETTRRVVRFIVSRSQ